MEEDFQKIFDGIYVNSRQLQMIRELTKTSPVIFMPSHRTYMDFLLVSLICFQYVREDYIIFNQFRKLLYLQLQQDRISAIWLSWEQSSERAGRSL